jgi:hypothetical protein
MNALEIVGLEWLGALALFLGFILLIRYLDHRERMAMIDRGLTPPERAHTLPTRPASAALRGGIITAMVGLAVTIGLYTLGYLLPPSLSATPGHIGPWLLPGLIPLFVGLALVASHYLAPPPSSSTSTSSPASSDPATGDAPAPDDGPAPRAVAHRRDWRLLRHSGAAPAPDAEQHHGA